MTDHLAGNKPWITKPSTPRIVITMGVIILLWIIIARAVDTQAIVAAVTESSYKVISTSTDETKMPVGTSDAEMLYRQAVAHLVGDGVSIDTAKALECYRQAAESGHPQAQEDLGFIYYTGYRVEQNYEEALKWYKKAALQGRMEAAWNLGLMYCHGEGTLKDYAEAAKWILVAAEAGSAEAQWTLGLMYGRGQGVTRDRETAMEWIQRAANQGDATAKNALKSEHKEFLDIMFHYHNAMPSEITVKAD